MPEVDLESNIMPSFTAGTAKLRNRSNCCSAIIAAVVVVAVLGVLIGVPLGLIFGIGGRDNSAPNPTRWCTIKTVDNEYGKYCYGDACAVSNNTVCTTDLCSDTQLVTGDKCCSYNTRVHMSGNVTENQYTHDCYRKCQNFQTQTIVYVGDDGTNHTSYFDQSWAFDSMKPGDVLKCTWYSNHWCLFGIPTTC